MTPSPDDIFAAHFWTWPDPALKRDAHGRVLFVNASFLQLFGGSVDDWRGQSIGGWHVPTPSPIPNRFEIRLPATVEMAEQVYDWIELTGPDGSAFALARNVTAFMAQPQAPQPVAATAHIHDSIDSNPVDVAMSPDPQPAILETPAEPEPVVVQQAPTAEVVASPVSTEFIAEDFIAPLAEPDVQPEPEPVAQTAPEVITDNQAPEMEMPEFQAPETDPDPVEPQPVEPAPIDPAPVAQEEPKRDFERRALPIEDEDAVLGNNWRDAVIAKAIGAKDGSEDNGEAAQAPAPMTKGAGGPIRILLAEDNAINALLTRTLLEAEGHTVETVEDGQLAVEAMKTQSFDLIFMDMRMPNMDGLEATRTIRRLSNVSQDLPIIALTANAFDDDRNACFDSGMNDFMTKPVSAEELSEMVARWTQKQDAKIAS